MKSSLGELNTYASQFFTEPTVVDGFKALRKKIGIPVEGFPKPKKTDMFTPYGPVEWRDSLISNHKKYNSTFKQIDSDIAKIGKDFRYPRYVYLLTAQYFFFYNQIKADLFLITNLQQYHLKVDPIHPLDELQEAYSNDDTKKYLEENQLPIIIKISPFITRTKLINSINKSWKEIEYLQRLYTVKKVVTLRTMRTLDRDNFIYLNREKYSREKIRVMVENKFKEFLTTEQIRKIISRKKIKGEASQ
jgi:hypothetical protein